MQGFQNQLDQYEITGSLSEDSANPVYLAKHRITQQKVAIKVIPQEKYSRLRKENGVSEAQAMESCQKSQHITKLIEEIRQDDKTFLVTKFVKNGDLLNFLETKGLEKLPESETRELISQIAAGLKEIHSQGLVHMDIKHLNILINESDDKVSAQITDFGMAIKIND